MQKKILIIDDDKELCEELAEFLIGEGIDVDFATTPEKGRELILSKKYNGLLIDFKMPRQNGLEFIALMRKHLHDVKIYVVSASLSIDKLVEEQGLSALVTGIMKKPFSLDELLLKINSIPIKP
jgi:DNA-binding response OmpR family regulator